MTDDLARSVQSMKRLEAALGRFMEASTAARQRLSDAAWADLVAFMNAHPDEVTIDDILEVHGQFVASLDSLAAPFPELERMIKTGHRDLIDKALDIKNQQKK